jgi:hypothetical protein
MRPSHTEVEERLKNSFRAFASDVPDHPPVPWSTFATTSVTPSRHWHRIIGVAASIILIVLATVLWASPSAGLRYHRGEALRVGPQAIAQIHRSMPYNRIWMA